MNSSPTTRGSTKRASRGTSPAAKGVISRASGRSSASSFRSIPVGEARADLAGGDEAIAVEGADDERADSAGALALARHPAADHELLALLVLDLEPGTRPFARLVAAVEALRDHVLHPLLPAHREQQIATARCRRRCVRCEPSARDPRAPRGAPCMDAQGATGRRARASRRPCRRWRCPCRQARASRPRDACVAAAPPTSGGPSGRRQPAHHRGCVVRCQRVGESAQLRVALGQVEPVPARKRERAALDACERADAVAPELETPARFVRRQGAHELRDHGRHRPEDGVRRGLFSCGVCAHHVTILSGYRE